MLNVIPLNVTLALLVQGNPAANKSRPPIKLPVTRLPFEFEVVPGVKLITFNVVDVLVP